MSADNWRICPRCAKRAENEKAEKSKSVNESYGKIPADEFLELVQESEKPVSLDETLREDYEQGILDDGRYFVSFSASCTWCNFTFSYEHSEMTDA